MIAFSNFWQVTGNDVSHIADSGDTHFMQEGIRLGTASNYNVVARNKVHDLGDDGRIATDVDASFNTFEYNTVTNVPIGYNDEMSGWGNIWRKNTVTNFTILGFGFRMKDRVLKVPSKDTSTHYSIVADNVATAGRKGAAGLSDGAIAEASSPATLLARSTSAPMSPALGQAGQHLERDHQAPELIAPAVGRTAYGLVCRARPAGAQGCGVIRST